jgi:hypothetical protein
MPEVWRVRYMLNSTLLQDVTFPSKNEAINYVTDNFPAHVRAPNAQWESLVTRGICNLSGEGVLMVEPVWSATSAISLPETDDYIAATPDSDATNSVCPHCSGYGSSMKDPVGVNTCTECGGSGVKGSETKGGE